MTLPCLLRSMFVLAPAVLLAACGSSAGSTGSNGSPQQTANVCPTHPKVLAYTAGMAFKGPNGVTVKLMDSEPSPPKLGDNKWTIEVEDPSGAPLDGATIQFKQYMPDHGHNGVKDPVITPQNAGTYELSPVNFNMEGYWENTVSVKTDSVTDAAVIELCVGS